MSGIGNKKISELDLVTQLFSGDTYITVNSGLTKQVKLHQIASYIGNSSIPTISGGTFSGTSLILNTTVGTSVTVTGVPTSTTITGGTYDGSSISFNNSTGGSFSVSGIVNTFTTGGSYNSNTITFTNSTGGTYAVTGVTDYFTTGATLSNNIVYFNRNNGLSAYSVDISSVNSGNTFVTGGTYSTGTTTLTLSRNDGNGVSITGVTTPVNFSNVVWVDKNTGSDSSGTGAFLYPFSTIKRALTAATDNQVIYVRPGTYLEGPTKFSTGVTANNVTIYAMKGVTLKGEDVETVGPALAFNEKYIFNIDNGKTFSFLGDAKFVGSYGLIGTQTNDAVRATIELDSITLSACTNPNVRLAAGHTKFTVKNGDLILGQRQGFFVPGTGTVDLAVLNGDIILSKQQTGTTSNQTRLFQLNSSTTSRKTTIRANNIKMDVNPDYSFTEAIDLFYISASGPIDIYANIVDTFVPNDGILPKQTGNDGCLTVEGTGKVRFFGSISSIYGNAVELLSSTAVDVEVWGDITSTNKSAIHINNTNSNSKVVAHGKMSSAGLYPTVLVDASSQAQITLDGVIEHTNSNPASVGLTINGVSAPILTNNVRFNVVSKYPITSNILGTSYNLSGNISSNKPLPSTAVQAQAKFTVAAAFDNTNYQLSITTTAGTSTYTYPSGAGASTTNIATGLAALVTGGGVSVTSNGTDVLVTAVTNSYLSIKNGTGSYLRRAKVEVTNTDTVGTTYSVTISGISFSYVSTANTAGAMVTSVPMILVNLKSAIEANGTIAPLVTITQQTYSLDIVSSIPLSYSVNSNLLLSDLNPLLTTSVIDAGYQGNLINSSAGVSVSNSLIVMSGSTPLATFSGKSIGFYGVTPVVKSSGLTSSLTSLSFTEPITPDYTIQDLTNTSPFGFVTKDEGNSALKVIANLQTRVDQLEAVLRNLGLMS